VLDGLINRRLANDPGDGGDQCAGIHAGVDEQSQVRTCGLGGPSISSVRR
jgi:hypothetical protein